MNPHNVPGSDNRPPIPGERLELELLLQQIADAQCNTFVIKDLEHRFLRVNRWVTDTLGIPAHELIGRTDLEVGLHERMVLGDPDSDWPGFWALDDAAIAAGCTTRTDESLLAYGNKQAHAAYTERTPLFDRHGAPAALLIQSRDVSREIETRRRMRSSQHALIERDAEFDTLDSIMVSMLRCRDVDSLLEQVVRTVIERTRADGAFLSMPNEAGDYLHCAVVAGLRGETLSGTRLRMGEGLIGKVWSSGRSIFVEDADAYGPHHPFGCRMQIGCLPLSIEGRVAGVLSVIRPGEKNSLEAHRPQLERILGLASLATSNVQLVQGTRRALESTRALARISRDLGSLQDVDQACDLVCQLMPEALDATCSICYRLEPDGTLREVACWLLDDEGLQSLPCGGRELACSAIVTWAARNGQSVTLRRDEVDARETDRLPGLRRRNNIGSLICAPVHRQGSCAGVLVVLRSRERRDFDAEASAVLEGVTQQLSMALDRHALSCELHHQAYHDPLTGLPNRRSLEAELEHELYGADEARDRFAVLFLDLDGFKHVNDTLGHAIGDRLLVEVAQRFGRYLQDDERLARLGGDEFALIVRKRHPDDALAVATRLMQALVAPFTVRETCLRMAASIGISRFPGDGTDIDALLRHADMAMYQSKRIAGSSVRHFDRALADGARERSELTEQLRAALESEQQLQLHYQPQVCGRTRRVVGCEALLRWYHPERGIVPPGDFIPLAEQSGLIDAIGDRVLEQAIRMLASRQAAQACTLRVAVNIGASQFQQPHFPERVLARLAEQGVAAHCLELEVTESVVMHDIGDVAQRLQQLRDAGVSIAIDDFGTGYSSLSYLQDLPVDVVKIDRAFVARIGADHQAPSLVRTIQMLADSLGLMTVAEGVETPEQRDAIERLGCTAIQGYWYGKPVAAEALDLAMARINTDAEARRAA